MTTFTTVTDLRLWVSERSGETTTPEDNEKIADAIRSMDDFPNWCEDATEFLETLPDDLTRLINAGEKSDAFHTGFEAAKQGEKFSDNPYAKELWGHDEWAIGYKEFNK